MDTGVWGATVHGVAKSQRLLSTHVGQEEGCHSDRRVKVDQCFKNFL